MWINSTSAPKEITTMKISNKRYKQLIAQWNPEMVVHVLYSTRNSKGQMTFSIAFFLEFTSKIQKLFKGCTIQNLFVKNENTGIVLYYFESFYDLWFYAMIYGSML